MKMDEYSTISEVMLKHHYRIDKLFHELDNEINQKSESFPDTFYKFKGELEKHFFIEEKAIFQLCNSENEESNEIREQLLKEHNILRSKLDTMEIELITKGEIDIYGFRKLLLKHKDFENQIFYPRVDRELDGLKKKQILERLTNPFEED